MQNSSKVLLTEQQSADNMQTVAYTYQDTTYSVFTISCSVVSAVSSYVENKGEGKMSTRLTSRSGFTLIELLVVIAIIAILAAILFPVFMNAKAAGQRTKCLSNMREIGMAIMNYSNDWQSNTPFAYEYNGNMQDWTNLCWRGYILRYTKSKGIFSCPIKTVEPHLDRNKDPNSHYGINTYLFWNYWVAAGKPEHRGWWNLGQVPLPSKTIMICENHDGDFAGEPWNNGETNEDGAFWPYHGDEKHKGGCFIFNDGHAKWLSIWQTEAGSTPNVPKSYYLWKMKDNIQPAQ
jgi:prepilin-type N-terminal cleavage/methylation domain-containing protein